MTAPDPREISQPIYYRNEHRALIRRAVSSPQRLDERSRCCGRKPVAYSRPDHHFFCPRCNREFDASGKQRSNWAFKPSANGFVEERPIPANEEREHLGGAS